MQKSKTQLKKALLGSAAGIAVLAMTTAAQAGGLSVREQSTQFLGSAFAGNGAGGGLSSMFWNPAGLADAGDGLKSESNLTLLLPSSEFTVQPGTSPLLGGVGTKQTQDRDAWITSSYNSYRVNKDLVLGLGINAPFGLSNEVNSTWAGRLQHRSAALLTVNINPAATYQIMPGVHVGAGLQFQYAKLRFKTGNSTSIPALGGSSSSPSTTINVDDLGVGFTAGILLQPAEGTSIGIGYRSAITHSLRGDARNVVVNPGPPPFIVPKLAARIDMDTPQLVTASIRQSITPAMRLLGTVEWTNWDVADVQLINLNGRPSGSALDLQWHNSWFFALGAEFDVSSSLTLRAGAAYELSPIQNPSERLAQVPDADRVWLGLGATYKVSDAMTLDLAYAHVFIDDSTLNRLPANGAPVPLVASVKSSADIFSVGLKMSLGSLF